jgi:hypothetical protein
MAEDIRKIPTKDLDFDGAFRRSRNGAIVLSVLVVSYFIQSIPFIGAAIEGWQMVLMQEEPTNGQVEAIGVSVIMGGLIALSLIATLFAWFMRSRVAMVVGVLLFGLNWMFYILAWMSGDFDISGLLFNVLGPFYLWKGIQGANRYHALKNGRASAADMSIFE